MTTLIPVIDRLRRRFDIARVCVVADCGMISAETVAELEARRLLYLLGVRERTDKLVRQLVLDDPAPFVPLAVKKRGKEIDYQAKTVTAGGTVLHRLPQPSGGGDRNRVQRQTLHRPLGAAPGRQLGLACSRRRAAADRPRRNCLLTLAQPKM